MAAFTTKQSEPLHIENTVMVLGKEELAINNAFSTYREMKLDGVISGSVSFIKSLVSKSGFEIEASKDATTQEKALVAALNKSLDNLDGYTKPRLLSQ